MLTSVGGWTARWDGQVADLTDAGALVEPADRPGVVVALTVGTVPGCRWASLLFAPSQRATPFTDATSDPVMVGVFAADACTRRGPLRSLMRQRALQQRPAAIHVPDLRQPADWARFAAASALSSPDVRSLLYVPVDDSGTVLVAAASEPCALEPAHRDHAVVAAAVRSLLAGWTGTDAGRSGQRRELAGDGPLGEQPQDPADLGQRVRRRP